MLLRETLKKKEKPEATYQLTGLNMIVTRLSVTSHISV